MSQAIEFWPLKLLSKVLEVHRDSISQSGSYLESVRVHSLTLSYTPGSMWCDSWAFSWLAPLQPLCLGRKPKARVVTTSQAYAKLVGFKQPIYESNGQLLLTNINLSILSIWKQHLWNVVKMPTTEKKKYILFRFN